MDVEKSIYTSTGLAAGEYLCATGRGAGFAVMETDQGNRDLNNDKDTDDEIMNLVRLKK
jgi:hypothetical protein